MARRYQVPNKPLGDFKIAEDTIYTRTLCADTQESGVYYDDNFGALASCDVVPVAEAFIPGGVCVNPAAIEDPDAIQPSGKPYPLKLLGSEYTELSNTAYVQVPWVNTWYEADVEDGVQCLCMRTTTGSRQQGLDDGPVNIGISVVPVTKISGLGDIAVSSYAEVNFGISDPIVRAIEDCSVAISSDVDKHILDAIGKHEKLVADVAYVSGAVYPKTETSSATEIANALGSGLSDLSSDFVAYLNNTLIPGTRTNPAYLSNETSSAT